MLLLEGYKDAKTDNLLKSIEKSKEVEFSHFILALGIENVGKKTAKDFAKKFNNIDELMLSNQEKLLQIDEVGEIIAECVVNYFSDQENIDEINGLFSQGVKILYEQKSQDGVFLGEKVVLTGTLSQYKRDDAAKIIESLGGEIMSSVSKNTTMVLAGENAGSKLDKAIKLGIKIIDEETFKLLIKT